MNKAVPAICLAVFLTAAPLFGLLAADTADKESGTIALSEAAPELYFLLRRNPSFYGDPNTVHGDLLDRSQILGNMGGVRDTLVNNGIYIDASVTQFLAGNVSGGRETSDSPRLNGSADYFLNFDSGKAGLWSGGSIFVHAESAWGKNVNTEAGSLLPSNYDTTMPVNQDNTTALSELYLVQALPGNAVVLAGKVNFAGIGDTNLFANNERTQFGYTGLVNNPILGSFYPYTPLGGGGVWQVAKEHQFAAIVSTSDGDATKAGFNKLNDGNYSYALQYVYSPEINGLPGHYLAFASYSSKELQSFSIDRRQLFAQAIGVVPNATKSDNYALLLNFDQYLWVKPGAVDDAKRRHQLPVGIGIFARAGFSPDDRNVIDQFYSLGVGGYGALIPGRDRDRWGIGWAGTHISEDVRNLLPNVPISSFEHAVEAFYNFQLAPAVQFSVNAQLVDSVRSDRDTAYVMSGRFKVDF